MPVKWILYIIFIIYFIFLRNVVCYQFNAFFAQAYDLKYFKSCFFLKLVFQNSTFNPIFKIFPRCHKLSIFRSIFKSHSMSGVVLQLTLTIRSSVIQELFSSIGQRPRWNQHSARKKERSQTNNCIFFIHEYFFERDPQSALVVVWHFYPNRISCSKE